MSDNSDPDIIFRQRPNIRKPSRFEDERSTSESEPCSGPVEGDFELLFLEIFGTGDEYNYIYKNQAEYETKERTVEPNAQLTPSECYEYIRVFVRGFNSLFKGCDCELIRELVGDYVPEYLSFYLDKMTIKEIYFIKNLIAEIREDTSKSIPLPLENHRIKGLLPLSEFLENLEKFEFVFLPQGNIELPFNLNKPAPMVDPDDNWEYEEIHGLEINSKITFTDDDKKRIAQHFKKTISQIAANSLFARRVKYSIMVSMMEPSSRDTSIHSLETLQKFYCGDQDDMNDQIRKLIIKEAYDAVHVNKEALERGLVEQGMLDGQGGLQRLVDLIVCLRGHSGTYAGVYFDRFLFSAVKIDTFGNFLESAVFKENETVELQTFLAGIDNVCLTSTSPNVKYPFQRLGVNFLYVPRWLSFFDDHKELSIPYNIALLVQNPFLYFARVWYHLSNDHSMKTSVIKNPQMLQKAVSIACSTCKLDWKHTISHRFGFMIFQLLNIDISDSYFSFEAIDLLENLKQVFDNVKYNNICTYFNLSTSSNLLERTLIHPTSFSMAIVLFKSAYHSLNSNMHVFPPEYSNLEIERDEKKIVELFVNQPELLAKYTVPGSDEDKEVQKLLNLKRIMLRTGEVYFSGASDDQIFDDVVSPLMINQIYPGTVIKIGADFYLCQISDATVYIRKSTELALNQIVKIEITGKNPAMLSYSGNIIEDERVVAERFRAHTLFRDMHYDALQDYMEKSKNVILIRPSSTRGCCSIVCRVLEGLFFTFKLKEVISADGKFKTMYEFGDRSYPTIDEFVNEHVKRVYAMLHSIVSFKYYFPDVSKARKYLEEPGEFARYAIILSREAPGYLEFLLNGKRVFAKIEADEFILKNRSFSSLDNLIRFIKAHAKDI